MEAYRVVLADDEEEIRMGISRKIDWAGLGFTLVGQAENGTEALELCEQLQPDVVLTDIKMPFMDGLELCARLRQSLPAAKLVVFSGFDDFEYARQAIGMNVSEYILKPINAPELSQVLIKLRQQLDERRSERRNMEALRRRYDESLPVLRELFYTRLLDGRIPPDQIRDRALRYELELPEGIWTAVLIRADSPDGHGGVDQDELILLSVRSFLQERFSLAGCEMRSVLYNDRLALLICMAGPEKTYPLLMELERLCALTQGYLGVTITAGMGLPCGGPEGLHTCMEGARAALDYRVLMAENRVIYIGDLEPDGPMLTFGEEEQQALSVAIKLGTREQVEQTIREQVERIRAARLSLPLCRLFFLEIVTALIRLARAADAEAFGPEFASVSVTDFRSLEEMGDWLSAQSVKLWEVLGRQRTDSAWKLVESAKAFIADNYADSTLSIETVCGHLHLSAAYFSTLFKRETGVSFTAYVTAQRMEQAALLLRETDEKSYRIAERTGYTDPNYFSYVFKRHFGVTPSKYRAGKGTAAGG